MTRDDCGGNTNEWFTRSLRKAFEFSLLPLKLTDSFPTRGSPGVIHNHSIKVLTCQRVVLFFVANAGKYRRYGLDVRSLRRFGIFTCELFETDLVVTGVILQAGMASTVDGIGRSRLRKPSFACCSSGTSYYRRLFNERLRSGETKGDGENTTGLEIIAGGGTMRETLFAWSSKGDRRIKLLWVVRFLRLANLQIDKPSPYPT